MKPMKLIIMQEQEEQTVAMELAMDLMVKAKVQLPVHGDRQQEHCMPAEVEVEVGTLSQAEPEELEAVAEEGTDTQPEPQERPILAEGQEGTVIRAQMSA